MVASFLDHLESEKRNVMPMKTGIHLWSLWIPACARMTGMGQELGQEIASCFAMTCPRRLGLGDRFASSKRKAVKGPEWAEHDLYCLYCW